MLTSEKKIPHTDQNFLTWVFLYKAFFSYKKLPKDSSANYEKTKKSSKKSLGRVSRSSRSFRRRGKQKVRIWLWTMSKSLLRQKIKTSLLNLKKIMNYGRIKPLHK